MALAEESQNSGANEALTSGNNLWPIDAVFPFGGREEARATLKHELLGDLKVKDLRPAPGGGWRLVQ